MHRVGPWMGLGLTVTGAGVRVLWHWQRYTKGRPGEARGWLQRLVDEGGCRWLPRVHLDLNQLAVN